MEIDKATPGLTELIIAADKTVGLYTTYELIMESKEEEAYVAFEKSVAELVGMYEEKEYESPEDLAGLIESL